MPNNIVTFENVQILSVFTGESKKTGQPVAHVEFYLPDTIDFFDCWFNGDEALAFEGIDPHTTINTMSFIVKSDSRHRPELHPYLY